MYKVKYEELNIKVTIKEEMKEHTLGVKSRTKFWLVMVSKQFKILINFTKIFMRSMKTYGKQ